MNFFLLIIIIVISLREDQTVTSATIFGLLKNDFTIGAQ
jgi:hypothetical protein